MDEWVQAGDDPETVDAVHDRPVFVARSPVRERLDRPFVGTARAPVEARPPLATQGQRAFEPIVLHVGMSDRPTVHVDVDDLHDA